MKIIVTGANGFLGSRLVNILSKKDFEVTALVRKGSDTKLLYRYCPINFVDYNDKKSILKLLKNHTILIHTAALTRAKTWNEFKEINIKLTEQLADLFNETQSMKQFIFISSQAATGPSLSVKPKVETDICTPVSFYGKSKLLAEHSLKKKISKTLTIFRPCSIYGPGEKDFLYNFKLIKRGLSIIPGKQKKFLNLIYSDEAAEYISRAINNPKAFEQTFFITDGKIYNLDNINETIKKVMQKQTINIRFQEKYLHPLAVISEMTTYFQKKPALINQQKVLELKYNFWLADNHKAVKYLQYSPENNFENNLRKTYKWYLEKNWL